MARTRLIPLPSDDLPEPVPAAPPAPPASAAPPSQRVLTLEILSLLLGALSQRLALWLSTTTLPLVVLGIGAALWWRVLPEPSPYQLVGVALYGVFGLCLLLARR